MIRPLLRALSLPLRIRLYTLFVSLKPITFVVSATLRETGS